MTDPDKKRLLKREQMRRYRAKYPGESKRYYKKRFGYEFNANSNWIVRGKKEKRLPFGEPLPKGWRYGRIPGKYGDGERYKILRGYGRKAPYKPLEETDSLRSRLTF